MSTDPQTRGAIEALLFVSDEPVSTGRLAKILDLPAADVDSVLAELSADYSEADRGIQLREVAGGWRLFTHPAHHDIIEKYVLSWDTRRLSQAALEALAVIAYHQPVTRGGVNAVRGVNSEGVVSSLVEKGLVREVGRDKNQGNAILYGTTRTFLEKFGLKDIKDLPPLEEFAPDENTKQAIRERLSAGSFGRLPLEDEQEGADDGFEDDIDDLEDQIEAYGDRAAEQASQETQEFLGTGETTDDAANELGDDGENGEGTTDPVD